MVTENFKDGSSLCSGHFYKWSNCLGAFAGHAIVSRVGGTCSNGQAGASGKAKWQNGFLVRRRVELLLVLVVVGR